MSDHEDCGHFSPVGDCPSCDRRYPSPSNSSCDHAWPTPGCRVCDSTVKPWTDDEPVPYLPKHLGTFTHEGETFAYGPHPSEEYEGFTAVFDQYDLILSVGLTPDLAIRGAQMELELIGDEIDDAINQILGWSNDAE